MRALRRRPRGVLDSRLGAKFAREILHVGGARPAAESFERFQNRPPRIDALLAQYGLRLPLSAPHFDLDYD